MRGIDPSFLSNFLFKREATPTFLRKEGLEVEIFGISCFLVDFGAETGCVYMLHAQEKLTEKKERDFAFEVTAIRIFMRLFVI